MKRYLAVVAVLFSLSATAEDYSSYKELYMKNESGGVVALTLEPCQIAEAVKAGMIDRAYATEGNGTKHEGCWISPDINPEELPEVDAHITIIPLVNLWFDGGTIVYPQTYFKPSEI